MPEESATARDARESLERELALTLLQSENIVGASAHLVCNRASVPVTFSDSGAGPELFGTIAQLIATGVDGLKAGYVSI